MPKPNRTKAPETARIYGRIEADGAPFLVLAEPSQPARRIQTVDCISVESGSVVATRDYITRCTRPARTPEERTRIEKLARWWRFTEPVRHGRIRL
jgi:hypothetical protein